MKNSTKFLSIAVLLLLLVNIALVILLVTGKGKPGPKHGDRKGPWEMIEKDVNMNESQKKEFEQLRDEHLKRIHAKYDTVAGLKATLFGLKAANVNDSIITSYLQQISKLQTEGNRLSYQHFQDVRKLFSGEQEKKYDEFIEKMLNRLRKRDSTSKDR
jgi:protein CpxP